MNRRRFLALGAAMATTPVFGRDISGGKLVTFSGLTREGGRRRAADFAGAPMLVHFWASWCVSCREEFPALDALQRDMGDRLRVVAISVDRLGWPAIDRTLEALAVRNLTVLHDLNREAALALNVDSLPTSLAVDKNGYERARHRGVVDWGRADIRAALEHAPENAFDFSDMGKR